MSDQNPGKPFYGQVFGWQLEAPMDAILARRGKPVVHSSASLLNL